MKEKSSRGWFTVLDVGCQILLSGNVRHSSGGTKAMGVGIANTFMFSSSNDCILNKALGEVIRGAGAAKLSVESYTSIRS